MYHFMATVVSETNYYTPALRDSENDVDINGVIW